MCFVTKMYYFVRGYKGDPIVYRVHILLVSSLCTTTCIYVLLYTLVLSTVNNNNCAFYSFKIHQSNKCTFYTCMHTANVPNYTKSFVCDCCVPEVLCINGICVCYVNFTILSVKIKALFNVNKNRKCWRNSFKQTILAGSLKKQSHCSVWHQRMRAYAHAFADIRKGYVRYTSCTFNKRWHTSVYVLLYAETTLIFQNWSAYASVWHIHYSYAHRTLDIRSIR